MTFQVSGITRETTISAVKQRKKRRWGASWTLAELRQLGRAADSVLARRTGRTIGEVVAMREKRRVGLPTPDRRWSAREVKMLGRYNDAELARRLRRGKGQVRRQRIALGIPALLKRKHSRRWTHAEQKLLGSMPDCLLATRLKRSVRALVSRRYYTQWDDAWLLTVLRREFCLLQKDRQPEDEKSLTEVQLEELLSNSKAYYSVFKRGDTFREVDEEFVRSLPSSFKWTSFANRLPKAVRPQVDSLQKFATKYRRALEKGNPELMLVEKCGFFLVSLLRLLDNTGRGSKDGMDFVRDALDELKRKARLTDAIVIAKKIKSGVGNEFLLASRDGETIQLGQVSRIADELIQAAVFFPPFFLFIYRRSGISDADLHAVRKQFGKLLAGEFVQWTKNL